MNLYEPLDRIPRLIIAADQRCSTVTPEDDQIWELDTSRGEPPGVAIQTTYGLRAYGIRVFPRFSIKKVPVSDPRTFASQPEINFVASNFVELNYLPFPSLDVNQKMWVPDSHTLVGQVGLTNTTTALVQLWMEWIVQLNPLSLGSPMTEAQISVNTVLQGQSGSLYPVFFLTGGPRGDLSAFPSLGIEVSLPPNASRQFSWALATYNAIDDSFYAARKATAYTLDNEQIKIDMLQKGQSIGFDFGDLLINQRLDQSQRRVHQLILPPFRGFENPWYVAKRNPDHGNIPDDNCTGSSADWGIQKITDIWALSRMLLPLRPDLIKGMLQNLLNQQGADGTLYAQLNWNGRVTNLAQAPLMASLVWDVYEYSADKDWLRHNFPALVRATRLWFQPENDRDGDGWPEWQHLLQTGMDELQTNDPKRKLDVLIKTAEWPSLAALLLKECHNLYKIATLINDDNDLEWIEDRIKHLERLMLDCWDQKRGIYSFRDQAGHYTTRGKTLHTFKQNGSVELKDALIHPGQVVIRINRNNTDLHSYECKVKGVISRHSRTITYTNPDFHWNDENGLLVSNETFSAIKSITVSGLKRGEALVVETPDYLFTSSDFMIPLWTGAPSKSQAQALIASGINFLDQEDVEIPFFLKIMWLEALCQADRKDLAARYFRQWYLGETHGEDFKVSHPAQKPLESLAVGQLQQLIPVKTLLHLLGIERISEDELILGGFNDYFLKVNVQYKKFMLDLQPGQATVENLNGESVVITEPGPHRIMLS